MTENKFKKPLKKSWVKNNLGYQDGLEIYQDKEMFSYSVDTILLGNFCSLNRSIRNVLEVGTNNAALSIFVAQRSQKINIDAVEIQPEAVELANYNVELNNLKDRINVINEDFNIFAKQYAKKIGIKEAKKYDLIICNPPYYNKENNIARSKTTKFQEIATHEIYLNLNQLVSGCAKIIEQKGYLAIVLPISRFIDLIETLRKYKFEPKRIQMIYPRVNDIAKFCLVESRYNAGWGSHFLKNLYLHPQDKKNHTYNEEVRQLYVPQKIKE
ncbi:tRNA1(Val) (adenine(37)-N6)-methyltransferase [[Mycoplasma] gypis]|uniref:tRNA1(Val) (Adenine(37)-N6)-methyltransferase n=1 Tax=[Mycoplasma] gypis TaxID=92404 RepID=A0ABZ2RR73_9BACT|nr:tRNA1(Val) (adenine(37)-N6)-methyltransferase [[Mycoplasma] gypis]MBN0919242.1 tRNA1(Val) (adenine(37)-N6)-methyltransferase [[Mycoplasma] gypis]